MKTLTLAKRELSATFYSPLAYVVGALFLAVCAMKFAPPPALWAGAREGFILVPHQQASMRELFEMMAAAMTIAAPLLTMRLISEEFRSGTIETLMTAPITDTQVIVGKFLGVLGFYLALLASTGVFCVLIWIYAQADPGVIAMGYFGLVLLGMAYLAVGIFASTLTRHQLVAAIVAIVILSIFSVLAPLATPRLPQPFSEIARRLSAATYLREFSRGLLDTRAVVFFLSLTGGFLFLSIKSLESRRWR